MCTDKSDRKFNVPYKSFAASGSIDSIQYFFPFLFTLFLFSSFELAVCESTSFASANGVKNECGGTRALSLAVGEYCDPGPVYQCRYGIVKCIDRDVTMCVPNCVENDGNIGKDSVNIPSAGGVGKYNLPEEPTITTITVQDESRAREEISLERCIEMYSNEIQECTASNNNLREETTPLKEKNLSYEEKMVIDLFCDGTVDCGEREKRGVCSEQTRECICLPGYSGPTCAHRDLCHDIHCENFGLCNRQTGLCECEVGFSGDRCEMVSACQPGGVFTEQGQCLCKPGYAGEMCDQCEQHGICVPVKSETVVNEKMQMKESKGKSKSKYSLARVPSEVERQEILRSKPIEGYLYGAFDPSFFTLDENGQVERVRLSSLLDENALIFSDRTDSMVNNGDSVRRKISEDERRRDMSVSDYSSASKTLKIEIEDVSRRLRIAVENEDSLYIDHYGWFSSKVLLSIVEGWVSKGNANHRSQESTYYGYDCQCRYYEFSSLSGEDQFREVAGRLELNAWIAMRKKSSMYEKKKNAAQESFDAREKGLSSADGDYYRAANERGQYVRGILTRGDDDGDDSVASSKFIYHNGEYYHRYDLSQSESIATTSDFQYSYGLDNTYFSGDYLYDYNRRRSSRLVEDLEGEYIAYNLKVGIVLIFFVFLAVFMAKNTDTADTNDKRDEENPLERRNLSHTTQTYNINHTRKQMTGKTLTRRTSDVVNNPFRT